MTSENRLAAVREDIAELKAEVKELREKVSELRANVKVLTDREEREDKSRANRGIDRQTLALWAAVIVALIIGITEFVLHP